LRKAYLYDSNIKDNFIGLTQIKMKSQIVNTARHAASTLTKEAGDISSVFPSLSGKAPEPLAARFSDVKRQLIKGNEDAVTQSWHRLLASLKHEIAEVKTHGSNVSRRYIRNAPEEVLICAGYTVNHVF
jgi:Protein of unknown function (DUF1479)